MRMYDPPHPGRILAACFDENRTVEDTAQKIGVPVQVLNDILACKAPITPEIAALLHIALTSTPPRIWLKLQARYDSWQLEHNNELLQQIYKKHNVVISSLTNAGTANMAFA